MVATNFLLSCWAHIDSQLLLLLLSTFVKCNFVHLLISRSLLLLRHNPDHEDIGG